MSEEHNIVALVYAAKESNEAADDLLVQYLPFIKSETAKFINRPPQEGRDDELSIAMFAFHEATLAYKKGKGAFLSFAARAIRNRLIDFSRKEKRHTNLIPLDEQQDDAEDDRTLIEKAGIGEDNVDEYVSQSMAEEEITHFSTELATFSLSLTDIAGSSPKQKRTLEACHQALNYAIAHPEIFDTLTKTKKLPISQLAKGAKISKKVLERHRDYMIAILVAYTNGFEIIRGHLQQIVPKGGQPE